VAFYLYWIEQSAFSIWLRESPSVLVFPTLLFLHTFAMAFLAGANAAIGLRVLGFAPRMRLAPMENFFPLMWSSFWIMAVTGVALLTAYPTKAFTNPVWYVKFVFIALGLVNMWMIKHHVFGDPRVDERLASPKWKLLASTSLFLWAGAITSGKLLAHTYTHLYSWYMP
jgi:hypothetical protein